MHVKIRIGVAPPVGIPAQTWTLKGCLLFGLNFAGLLSFRKQIFPWCSNHIVLSSVKMTSLNFLFSKHCWVKARQVTGFVSRTIWQYWGPHFFLCIRWSLISELYYIYIYMSISVLGLDNLNGHFPPEIVTTYVLFKKTLHRTWLKMIISLIH